MVNQKVVYHNYQKKNKNYIQIFYTSPVASKVTCVSKPETGSIVSKVEQLNFISVQNPYKKAQPLIFNQTPFRCPETER